MRRLKGEVGRGKKNESPHLGPCPSPEGAASLDQAQGEVEASRRRGFDATLGQAIPHKPSPERTVSPAPKLRRKSHCFSDFSQDFVLTGLRRGGQLTQDFAGSRDARRLHPGQPLGVAALSGLMGKAWKGIRPSSKTASRVGPLQPGSHHRPFGTEYLGDSNRLRSPTRSNALSLSNSRSGIRSKKGLLRRIRRLPLNLSLGTRPRSAVHDGDLGQNRQSKL